MAQNHTFTSSSPSSTASPSSASPIYDVFINHRGPDVKKTFASHLYRRLLSCGFRVFLDKQELHEGEELTTQIEEAIATASVHVAIFSMGYAESEWCLKELRLMLRSRGTIIPVFYHVKPHELRWTRGKGKGGVYAKALHSLEKKKTCDPQTHKEKRRYDPKTIENWRDALSRVAGISGLELEACNGDEGELVDKIVHLVEKKVIKPPLDVATYPTGLDEKLQDFERAVLLQHDSGETKVAGIMGLGGVGKTTLAKQFFNCKRSSYDRSCFLFEVREAAARSSLTSLQRKLYKDLTGQDQAIDNIDEGIGMFAHRASRCRALIILDDVDSVEQLRVLYSPLKDVLRSGSLILITSRNKDVLTSSGMRESSIFKLTGLDREHSQELFCLHAFHQPCPVLGFEQVVRQFLEVCQGLPLSLKVIGALLYMESPDMECWKDQLRKMSIIVPTDIQTSLKVSYDSLDKEDKEIFLDIACFFLGEDRDKAIRIWDGCGWGGSIGLRNLENKCLVEVDTDNCIRMHDNLRDLGRALAEKEPWLRLWRPTEKLSPFVFHRSSVRGISMVQQRFGPSFAEPVQRKKRFVDMNKLQLLRANGDCLENIANVLGQSDLLWLCWNDYPYTSLPSWIPTKNLRVLELPKDKCQVQILDDNYPWSSCQMETLWETENEAPVQLRELLIGHSLLQFPKSIGELKHLQKIVADYVETLHEEFFHLLSLKHLRMHTHMELLPESLGNLTNLQYLDLSGSSYLQKLPDSFGNLTNLQYLDLSGSYFQMLPNSFGNLINLQYLDLSQSFNLQTLPPSFQNLVGLKHLCLKHCCKLMLSSETLENITTLESLDLQCCGQMEGFPPQVTSQRYLEKLYLWNINLKELPHAIGNLSNLEILVLECPLLEMLPASLGNLGRLKELTFSGCSRLKCLPDSIGDLKQLTKLRMRNGIIKYLPMCVMELNNLEDLIVTDCPLRAMTFAGGERVAGGKEALTNARGRRMLDSSIGKRMLRLKDLQLWGTQIKEISFPEGVCSNLQHLNIKFCHELVEVGALPTTLVSLELEDCPVLKKITGLCGLSRLIRLDIRQCQGVKELRGLKTLISNLEGANLERIWDLAGWSLEMPSSDGDESDFSDDDGAAFGLQSSCPRN